MAYSFATQDGSGREYDRNSYGSTVGSGGSRRNGMRPSRPSFQPMEGNPASVAIDAPRIPNLAPIGGSTPGAPGGGGTGYAPKLAGQVKAYGDMVGEDFRKSVGSMLGDLNGIGALRSGAVQSGLNDLTTTYGRQIGNYAAQTATDAAKLDQQDSEFTRGLGFSREQLGEQRRQFDSDDSFRRLEGDRAEADRQFERSYLDRQYNDQKNASKRRGIGKLLGGALGVASSFIPGGKTAGKVLGAIGGVFK